MTKWYFCVCVCVCVCVVCVCVCVHVCDGRGWVLLQREHTLQKLANIKSKG